MKVRAKAESIKAYLELPEDIDVRTNDDNIFDCDGEEWLVLTDTEAEDMVVEYVRELLWAFSHDFLARHCDAIAIIGKGHWEALAASECENMNSMVKRLLGSDLEHVISEAISEDGRGHFLASWDGEEVDLPGGFCGFRMN